MPLSHPAVFPEARGFDARPVRDDEYFNQYIAVERLPDGLSLFVTHTDDWLAHCALPDNTIARLGNKTVGEAGVRLTKLIYHRLRRVIGTVPLNGAYVFEFLGSRTNGEAYSCCNDLGNLATRRLRGLRDSRQEPPCFTQPLLRVTIRYLHKRNIHFWENAH